MDITYTTDIDVRDMVAQVLGDVAAEFDIDAITADLVDAAERGDMRGYLHMPSDAEFWDIVARHDLSA